MTVNYTNGALQRPNLRQAAIEIAGLGYPVLSLDKRKRPTVSGWEHLKRQITSQTEIDRWFNNSETVGVGVVAGKVSGNLEVIDVDVKHSINKNLWTDYKNLIIDHNPELYKKLVIENTVNGGIHLLFKHRGETVRGSHHLAKRPTAEQERLEEKERKGSFSKFHPLIETRGEGGYAAAAPTPGYEFIQGNLSTVPILEDDEILLLYALAKTFDQMPVETDYKEKKVREEFQNTGLSPFDDYNQRADIPSLLENHGWKIISERGNIIQLKRPGHTDSRNSASFFKDRKIFYVFTTSTEFDSEKGYTPSGVYTILEHGGDYSAASKKLLSSGYGEQRTHQHNSKSQITVTASEQTIERLQSPIPLPDNHIETPKLAEQLLPKAWREWLADTSERLQCPADYAAISALTACASLIGNRVRVKPKMKDSWLVVPNLWGAIVGVPGVMKTPAVNEGLIFFREITNKERQKYEKWISEANFEKEFNEAKKKELVKKMAKATLADKLDLKEQYEALLVEEPREKRLWTSDATVEKLGELLNENPNGILNVRDELTGWFRMLDRVGHEQDRAFYLESWNGDGTFQVDRIGRGSLFVKNLTISILGTIQPSMIEPYLRSASDGSGDDGLIQRFQLLVYPDVPKDYKYIDRTPKGREKARDTFKFLYELQPPDIGAKYLAEEWGGHAYIQFDDEGQEFFQDWMTNLERSIRSDTFDTALESHLAKYRSLMPSLALIFHLLDRVTGVNKNNSISLEHAELSAAWCSYLQKHAEKLYGMVLRSDYDYAREILKRILSKDLTDEFTARDIYGRHWAKLKQPENVKRGLEILVDYGYLCVIPIQNGGRPTLVYRIHEEIK